VSDPLADALADVLRPVVAELVAQEFDRRAAEFEPPSEPAPWQTVAEYAREHRTTPEAVRARIRRRTLEARKPPGAREWLIPNDGQAGGHAAARLAGPKTMPPHRTNGRGRDTGKGASDAE
jgi:hypothetical protein